MGHRLTILGRDTVAVLEYDEGFCGKINSYDYNKLTTTYPEYDRDFHGCVVLHLLVMAQWQGKRSVMVWFACIALS